MEGDGKRTYQLPPRNGLNFLTPTFGGRKELTYSTKAFLTIPDWNFTAIDIRLVDDIWDSSTQDFLPWEEAKDKFNLDESEEEMWMDITCKIADQWCNFLNPKKIPHFPVIGLVSIPKVRRTRHS